MTTTTVTNENRSDITSVYCHRLLDDMDFKTMYGFAFTMLKNSKDGLTNKQLEEQIADYYPDLLEN